MIDHAVDRRLFWLLACLAFLVGSRSSDRASGGETKKKYAHEFYHDFRGHDLAEELKLFDRDEQFVKKEKEGLRITLPKDRESFLAVGIRTQFAVKGDFEITSMFEILHAEEPDGGFGVGVTMRIEKADGPEAATLGRLVRAKGAQVVIWDQLKPNGKFAGDAKPCTDKLVRLRWKRVGATLSYQWAAGAAGDDFQEIKSVEFGAEDLKHVALSALTGKKPCKLDVRFLDFRIQSSGVLPVPTPTPVTDKPADGPAQPRSREWLAVLLFVGLAVTLLPAIALGAWLYLRQRGGAAPAASESGKKKRP